MALCNANLVTAARYHAQMVSKGMILCHFRTVSEPICNHYDVLCRTWWRECDFVECRFSHRLLSWLTLQHGCHLHNIWCTNCVSDCMFTVEDTMLSFPDNPWVSQMGKNRGKHHKMSTKTGQKVFSTHRPFETGIYMRRMVSVRLVGSMSELNRGSRSVKVGVS